MLDVPPCDGGRRGGIGRRGLTDPNAVAGEVPCADVHEPQRRTAADLGPVVRLAGGEEREPDAEATGGSAARRGVGQRYVLLLHAGARRAQPDHAILGGDSPAGLHGGGLHLPGPAAHRRLPVPPLGEGGLHLVLRGCHHPPSRPMGLLRRYIHSCDDVRGGSGAGRVAVAGTLRLLHRRQRWGGPIREQGRLKWTDRQWPSTS